MKYLYIKSVCKLVKPRRKKVNLPIELLVVGARISELHFRIYKMIIVSLVTYLKNVQ